MTTLILRMPDDQANRLKAMARHRGISVNKLIEELPNRALSEFDTETRFRAYAAKARPEQALQTLKKLDNRFGKHPAS